MADLIDREALLDDIQAAADKRGMGAVVAGTLKRYVKRAPAVDAVEVGSCEGCIYSHRKRPQKCSCCRRNKDLKDCYERREENAAD